MYISVAFSAFTEQCSHHRIVSIPPNGNSPRETPAASPRAVPVTTAPLCLCGPGDSGPLTGVESDASILCNWVTSLNTVLKVRPRCCGMEPQFLSFSFLWLCQMAFSILIPCMLSCFSCVPFFATPWTIARQAPLSLGCLQARTLELAAVSSSKGSSQPRDRSFVSYVSHMGRLFFITSASWEAWPGIKPRPSAVRVPSPTTGPPGNPLPPFSRLSGDHCADGPHWLSIARWQMLGCLWFWPLWMLLPRGPV